MTARTDACLVRIQLGIFIMLVFAGASARASYAVTYTNLNPAGGAVSYASGTSQVGYAFDNAFTTVFAALWSGPSNAVINLNPARALGSYAYAAAGDQQGGFAWFDSYLDAPLYAALWNSSAASFRNLSPAGAEYSEVFGMSQTQQVGVVQFGAPHFHGAAALWYRTAASFVDLAPEGFSGIAWAVAAGQQAGSVYFLGGSHAAIWSGTAASFRDLHPAGASSSELLATTGNQQAGWASGHAALWSGTAETFVDLHPAGASWSKALATLGSAQAGFVVFGPVGDYRHAVIWFGSSNSFIDLHASLPAETYRESQVQSLWSDGTNIIAGGQAITWPPGMVHPIVWTLTRQECPLTCPTNITVCNDHGQCGAIVDYTPPAVTNCNGIVITCVPPPGSFFPVGANIVVCTAKEPAPVELTNTCAFLVTVRDGEPPSLGSIVASPATLWPPNHKMRPVTLRVSATDNCHVARTRIVEVTSNEAGSSGDWQVTGDLTLDLRAERSGNGAGRVYTITIECADDSGNTSRALATVAVPH